ncbi:MAG: hypothetical protein K2G36_07770 [Ruminococcus sp.]|nr:hypothetical protein [Ruminococcus sp.]
MKKLSTYLISLFLSIFLVFLIIASAVAGVLRMNITEQKSKAMFGKNNVYSLITGELQKYFSAQYNTTGIPADVYMEALDESYIINVTDAYVNSMFDTLKTGKSKKFTIPENETLENNIRNFFSDYADNNNYEKNDVYEKKVSATIENAYRVTENYCDVYKYATLQEHGVLSKISAIFSRIGKISLICTGITVFLIILLIVANMKSIRDALYWTGISGIIAGILGTLPTAWLISADYFDSFAIKQPQIFKAFTGTMYAVTESVMTVNIAVMISGIVFVIIYGLMCKADKK